MCTITCSPKLQGRLVGRVLCLCLLVLSILSKVCCCPQRQEQHSPIRSRLQALSQLRFRAGWSEEGYTPHSTMEVGEDAGSAAAPHPDAAAANGDCSANATMQPGNKSAEQELQYIEVYEGESPRLQWHHPDLYDTLVQVIAT